MSKILYDHKWMDLKEDRNGEAFVAMSEDAIMIVPVTYRGEILFIEEKSIAYQMRVLTLPTGAVEKNEKPEITANRELQEEVGYRADMLSYVGTLHPAIKYMQWQCQVYLAQNLVQASREGDETSPVKVKAVSVSEVNQLIASGKLSDATTIAAISLARDHIPV